MAKYGGNYLTSKDKALVNFKYTAFETTNIGKMKQIEQVQV